MTAAAAGEDYTLRVTKRQLEEAISQLDSSLQSSAAPTKKRRGSSTATAQRVSTPLLLSLLPSHAAPIRPTTASPPPPPPTSYTPLSLPSLLSRIATYKLSTFSCPKPPPLLPSSLALQGWINKGTTRERVQCITCHKGVILTPPAAGWSSLGGSKVADEYQGLVGNQGRGHEPSCPWRMRGASKGLYRVQVGGRRKVLSEVGEGARALRGLQGMRVELGEDVFEGKERAEVVKAVRDAAATVEGETELGAETILLALFGWTAPPSSSPPSILTCTYCARQALTAPYLPSSISEKRTFNPLTSHALFCPFVDHYAGVTLPPSNGSSSSLSSVATGVAPSRAGWKLRVEAIAGGRYGRGQGGEQEKEKRGTRELMSYVRGLLGPKGR